MSVSQHFTETGSTKRSTISSSRGGARATNLSGLSCTSLFPDARGEIRQRYGIDTPNEVYSVYVDGHPDILGGDAWVQDGVEYDVRAVAPQAASPRTGVVPAVTELVVEKVAIQRT